MKIKQWRFIFNSTSCCPPQTTTAHNKYRLQVDSMDLLDVHVHSSLYWIMTAYFSAYLFCSEAVWTPGFAESCSVLGSCNFWGGTTTSIVGETQLGFWWSSSNPLKGNLSVSGGNVMQLHIHSYVCVCIHT